MLGSILGGMLGGSAGGWIDMALQNGFMEEDRNQRQEWQAGMVGRQEQFQMEMANTAYQRAVKDMSAAGINPMLAAHVGGAAAPQGASPGSPGSFAPSPGGRINAMTTAAQVEVAQATAEKLRADADLARASKDEVVERTPTHAANIALTKQKVNESIQVVEKLAQDTRTSAQSERTSAAQQVMYEQQVENLKAELPKIAAMVQQLKAHTKLTTAQVQQSVMGAQLSEAQIGEIRQRVQANLPTIEAALKTLEEKARQLDMPRRGMEAAAHDSYAGALGALLRALSPLSLVFNVVK